MTRILLVCRCNICRSPMAQAVVTHWLAQSALAGQLQVETAGTHGALRGTRADPRVQAVLARHGYAAPRTRARAITRRDFARYDQILAMDQDNLGDLQALCPAAQQHKLGLLLDLAAQPPAREIPDPYFGGPLAFERALLLCEAGAKGLLQHWAMAPPG